MREPMPDFDSPINIDSGYLVDVGYPDKDPQYPQL